MEKKKVKKETSVVSFLENTDHMENFNVEVREFFFVKTHIFFNFSVKFIELCVIPKTPKQSRSVEYHEKRTRKVSHRT